MVYATFFTNFRRNKEVVGPTIIFFLFCVSSMPETGEVAISHPSLFVISLVWISLKPNTLLVNPLCIKCSRFCQILFQPQCDKVLIIMCFLVSYLNFVPWIFNSSNHFALSHIFLIFFIFIFSYFDLLIFI